MFKHTLHSLKRRHDTPPKHRALPERSLAEAPRKALRTTLVLSAIAVAGTGTAVAGGVALHGPGGDAGTLSADATAPQTLPTLGAGAAADALRDRDRDQSLSRSARRVVTHTTTTAGAGAAGAVGKRSAHTRPAAAHQRPHRPKPATHRSSAPAAAKPSVSHEDPQQIASGMLASYGWDSGQFGCLVDLWNRESSWRVTAENPSSGAYGIPQSLPGSKMASAGADWRTNPVTQIRWGLGYIRDAYGSPCGAWAHSESTGWY